MDRKLTPGEIIIVVSGAVALLFSFFNWYEIGSFGENAWDENTFPLATYVPLIGLVMAGHILLTRLGNVNLPDRPLGFTWTQIHLALGAFATLLMLGWLFVLEEEAIGFWLCLLAAIGLLVGAIILHRDTEAAGPRTGTTPPTPF